MPLKSKASRTSSFGQQQRVGKDVKPLSTSTSANGKTKPATNQISKPQANVSSKPTGVSSQKQNKGTEKTVNYDRNVEIKFEQMMKGDLTDLPPLPRSVVRIFLSSTFSDTKVERNILSRKVYPKLRDYCSELGLDFQVVDLRWGVVDEAQNDHSATKICLKEIENCQRVSLGPNFITFVSHRYGGQPLPTELSVEQFEKLRAEVRDLTLKDGDLLDKWYWRDDNNEPSIYVLQPVRTHLNYFGDMTEGNENLKQKDEEIWSETLKTLKCLLRKAADSLFKKKQFSEAERHFFYQSVTECEIENGILKNKEAKQHTLLYHREVRGLYGDLDNKLTQKYIECKIQNGMVEVDEDIQAMIHSLIQDKISEKLTNTNRRSYMIKWHKEGIDPDVNTEHKQYLEKFCTDFTDDVIDMISKAKNKKDTMIRQSEYYSKYDEVLHHLKFCVSKCQTFCGQEKILKKVKNYISDENNRKPLVLYAQSGAGKTALMAMVFKNLKTWLNKKYIGVIRFLGTSPDTINIYDVLFSVCGQIADDAVAIMEPVAYRNIQTLAAYLPRFLRRMATSLKYPIIIMLDSVDQLADVDFVFLMWWLPHHLPANVKIILSTLPNEYDILKNLKKGINEPRNFIEVPILPPETGKEIIEKYLNQKKRRISPSQMSVLLSKFEVTPTPLYLKLQLDEALKWGSYIDATNIDLPATVREAINNLFDDLEHKFGKELIESALGLITVGFNGLSEIELEDALSCDNDVLDEVYRYHDPPDHATIRIPPVLWARVRFEIQEYLVERLSQGKTTIYWYHRQFIEVATERYASNEKQYRLHKILFELFSASDSIEKDIYLSKRKLLLTSVDRQITPQPLNKVNLRKLECMLHHVHLGVYVISVKTAKDIVFCNLNFIHVCLNAFTMERMIKEYSNFLAKNPDKELECLVKFFSQMKTNLKSLQALTCTLLAYISPEENQESLKNLLKECRNSLQTSSKQVLIPTFACLSEMSLKREEVIFTFPKKGEMMGNVLNGVLMKMKDEEEGEKVVYYDTVESSWTDLNIRSVEVNLVKVSPSQENVAVSTKEGVNIVKMSSMKKKFIASKTKSKICQIFFNSDSSFMGILSSDNSVDIYQVKDLTLSSSLKVNGNIVNIFLTDDSSNLNILTVGEDKTRTKAFVSLLNAKGKNVAEVEFELNNNLVCCQIIDEKFVVAYQANLNIYKADNLEIISNLKLDIEGDIDEMLISDIKQIAVVFSRSMIIIVNLTNVEITRNISHNSNILCRSLSSDGETVIVGNNGEITLYSCSSGEQTHKFSELSLVPLKYVGLFEENVVIADLESRVKAFNYEKLMSLSNCSIDQTIKGDHLLQQMDIVSIVPRNCGEILATSHQDGKVKLWNLLDASFIDSYDKGARFDEMLMNNSDTILALDNSKKSLNVFNFRTGENMWKDGNTSIPSNVLAMTLNNDKTQLYFVSQDGTVKIHILNLSSMKITNSITVQKMHEFVSLRIFLSASERYLVFQAKATESDVESIKAMWKKGANHAPQLHPYRLSAVDVTATTGAVSKCFRQLTKIPSLCQTSCSYKGNTVMFAARRHVIYWDVPTGKCDQQMSKGTKLVMIYRPDWTGEKLCKGHSTCMEHSSDRKFTVVGSQDGYVINYKFDSGLPVDKKAPPTRHSAEVSHVVISADSNWVASACLNGVVKLWSPVTGLEVCSLNIKNKVKTMLITPNSQHLVIKTFSEQPRILIFKLSVN